MPSAVVEVLLDAELDDGAIGVRGDAKESAAVGGGEVVGVLLKVLNEHFLGGFFVSYFAGRASSEDDLDVRVLVRPVPECIEAVPGHGGELEGHGGDHGGQRLVGDKEQCKFSGKKKKYG